MGRFALELLGGALGTPTESAFGEHLPRNRQQSGAQAPEEGGLHHLGLWLSPAQAEFPTLSERLAVVKIKGGHP